MLGMSSIKRCGHQRVLKQKSPTAEEEKYWLFCVVVLEIGSTLIEDNAENEEIILF